MHNLAYQGVFPAHTFGELDLPVCQAVCDEVVWLPQTVLLGDERDMQDIVTAVQKVRDAVDRDGVAALVDR